MKTRITAAAALLILITTAPSWAQDCAFKTKNDESLSQAMQKFHETMAALVHGPADRGDYTQVRARAGELAGQAKGIVAANLPEKLAKRCPEISAKAGELAKAADELASQGRAVGSDDALKAGLDKVHAAYRALNSSLTTLQDLLDGFHDLLHPLWHEAYPGKDVAAIKAEIPKLKVRAKLILSTAEAREKSRAPGAKSLLEAVTTLEEAAAANDNTSILEALRVTHDAYEKLAEGQH
jgi:hypothetical protein